MPRRVAPESEVLHYHLACYECQLGDLTPPRRERKGVEPFLLRKSARRLLDYAQQRGRLGNALVRIYDVQGQADREVEPPEEEQMLYYPSRP